MGRSTIWTVLDRSGLLGYAFDGRRSGTSRDTFETDVA
jgi:hypothetical protein